jgi:primosomal protein N'
VRTAWQEQVHPADAAAHILSTTIRLHQLAMEAPPVDYGVLMLYNTGDPRKWTERNPILDIRDVSPYLKRLDDYPLPLAAAYPVYSWLRVIQGVNVVHTVEAAEILQVKEAVEKKRQGLKRSIITYHLDKENINRYKPKTYEAIYHH